MDLGRHYRRFARYNAWANERLYDACAQLAPDEYTKARKAFFGSIHATLNHLVVCDLVWFGRVEGEVPAHVTSLDQQLYDDFKHLRAARGDLDRRIVAIVDGVDDFDRRLRYRNMAGQSHEDPVELALATAFNHQTHHRGQVHDMLTQTDVAPPPLDLIYFARVDG